ncbi:refilin-A isoform 2-T2 [Lycodopsis pacificus]
MLGDPLPGGDLPSLHECLLCRSCQNTPWRNTWDAPHAGAAALPYPLLNSTSTDPKTRMYPVFFGESIEVNPKPEQEIKCNSEVKYDSDKHYRDQVYCAPVPTATSFSETVVAVRNCTWKSYKSQVYLEPRLKPISYQSTTIIYPKHAKNSYRTTLKYNPMGSRRWFVSTVQLESSEDTSPCIIYTEDL